MKILLKDIKDVPTKLDFGLEAENLSVRANSSGDFEGELAPAYNFSKPASFKGEISKTGTTIHFSGQANASFITNCARCTEDAESAISFKINCRLKPQSTRIEEDQEEDLELSYYSGKFVELGPIVEDRLMLGLPFQVLCSESCKGICSSCGVNLNSDGCVCEAGERESDEKSKPFAALKDLKIQ